MRESEQKAWICNLYVIVLGVVEHFDIECVPIVGLLADRVRLAVIVHVYKFRQTVLDNFCE